MAYATKEELKARIGKSSTASDDVLTALLAAAESVINGFCNRPDGFTALATATERYFPGTGKPYILIDECVAVTAVAVKDSSTDTTYTAWTAPATNLAGDGDYLAFAGDPQHPDFNRLPYTGLMVDPNGDYSMFTTGKFTSRGGFRPSSGIERMIPTVKVTAKWGYAVTAPAQVKEATILQAARWYKRGESSWADTLANAEMGMLMYRKALDPDLQMMLVSARLVKPGIG